MEMLDALSQTFDHASKVVAGVRPDQLDAPPPTAIAFPLGRQP